MKFKFFKEGDEKSSSSYIDYFNEVNIDNPFNISNMLYSMDVSAKDLYDMMYKVLIKSDMYEHEYCALSLAEKNTYHSKILSRDEIIAIEKKIECILPKCIADNDYMHSYLLDAVQHANELSYG